MNTFRNRNQLQPATNAEVRRAEERAEAILVEQGIIPLLSLGNSSYEQIPGMNDFHVVPKTSRYSKEEIEAGKNLIADHKSKNSTFWNPLEHTRGGDLKLKPEIFLPAVVLGQVIEVDFVPQSQNVTVHTPSHSAVA